MLRWPLRKTSESAIAPVEVRPHRIVFDGVRLKGEIAWPHDPVYRPMVGVFVARKLERVAASYRRPRSDKAAEWACVFDVDLGDFAERLKDIEVVCLETGEALFKERSASLPGQSATLDIADLIELADKTKKPWDCSGFLSFLDLSIPDQVDFLYRCILERGADPSGLHSFIEMISGGRTTILDLRDNMTAGGEFRDGVQKTIYSRLGHWIVWGGLKDVLPSLVQIPTHVDANDISDRRIEPGFKSVLVSSLERISEVLKVGRYLARVALGPDADEPLLTRWERDYSALISAVTLEINERKAARRAKSTGTGLLRFNGLLGSMRVGEAGRAKPGAVASRPGASGVVFFGPYLRLNAGAYRLILRLHAQRTSETERPRVHLEAVRDHLILGWLNIQENTFASATHVLEFELPQSVVEIEGALIEFRLRCNAAANLEVFDVSLERLPDGAQTSSGAATKNWLPMLSIGDAGEATAEGVIGKAGAEGNLVYGPYRALPLGKYMLVVEYDGRGGQGASIRIQAVDSAADVILSEREVMLAMGPSRAELFFESPPPASAAQSPPPLEFRVGKSSRADVLIKSVSIERLI